MSIRSLGAGTKGPKGDKGDAGPQGATGPQGAQGVPGSTGATGAMGATGATGPAGAKGDTGAAGKDGATGATGSAGKDGAAATITVGTVTTGSPGSSVTFKNVGTSTAATFDISIPQGATGSAGKDGTSPTAPTISIGTVSTLSAGASATAGITGSTPTFTLNLGIPQGAAGSNASATPLATATPLIAGTGAVGTSAKAAREDHVHPAQTIPAAGSALPKALGTAAAGVAAAFSREDHVHPATGSMVLVGNVTVSETLLISLGLGMKRMTLALSGVAVGDKLVAVPNGTPTTGCEVVNAYPASTNNVSIGYYTPALGIAATYSIPVSVYRVAP